MQTTRSSKEFKLIVECVTNGIVDLQISEWRELFRKAIGLNNYVDSFNNAFQFIYRKCRENQWKTKHFEIGRIIKNGKLHIRVPVLLNNYNLEFYLKIHYKDKESYSSHHYVMNIPSFLIHTNFKIDQVILFKPDNGWFTNNALIKEILEDNYYKIQYYKYDATKGPKSSLSSWEKKIETIHVSRIFCERKKLQQMIDLTDHAIIYHNLLIRRHDDESNEIFNAIHNGLKDSIKKICIEMYDSLDSLANDKAMQLFMTKNVFDMLFIADYDHKIGCFVDGNDGWLNCENLKQCDNKLTSLMLKDGTQTFSINHIVRSQLIYSCDWCSVEIRDWDFLFPCNAHLIDQHYYCLQCVNTVIILNGELKQLLTEILDGQLIDDCSQTIVDYVVGKVSINIRL